MEPFRRAARLMGWLSDKRLDDHIRVQGDRWATSERQHDALDRKIDALADRSQKQVEDLSSQMRGEFEGVKKAVEARHLENRNRIWAVLIIIIRALATSYFPHRG